jgi:UDP-N-acetylmuramyl tripeptide synthase
LTVSARSTTPRDCCPKLRKPPPVPSCSTVRTRASPVLLTWRIRKTAWKYATSALTNRCAASSRRMTTWAPLLTRKRTTVRNMTEILAIRAMPAILPMPLRLPRRPHRNRRTVPTRCPPTWRCAPWATTAPPSRSTAKRMRRPWNWKAYTTCTTRPPRSPWCAPSQRTRRRCSCRSKTRSPTVSTRTVPIPVPKRTATARMTPSTRPLRTRFCARQASHPVWSPSRTPPRRPWSTPPARSHRHSAEARSSPWTAPPWNCCSSKTPWASACRWPRSSPKAATPWSASTTNTPTAATWAGCGTWTSPRCAAPASKPCPAYARGTWPCASNTIRCRSNRSAPTWRNRSWTSWTRILAPPNTSTARTRPCWKRVPRSPKSPTWPTPAWAS